MFVELIRFSHSTGLSTTQIPVCRCILHFSS